ncbi:MAG: DUF5989 family protein [Candidatus Paceibacterota bacterium]
MNSIKKTLISLSVRFSILKSLLSFFWRNRMWWIIPMLIVLSIFFFLMIFAQSSPLGPLIYTIF